MGVAGTLPEALAAAASSTHGYRFVGAGGVECHKSYAEMYADALRVAGSLTALGLRRGELVAIILGDPESFLLTLFGASIAGLVPVLLYRPPYTIDLRAYLEATSRVLRLCKARGVVTSTVLLPHIESLKATCPDMAVVVPFDALQSPEATTAGATQAAEIAFIQFTSGSTATPKGVVITQRNLSANVAAFSAGLGGSASDVAVSWLPLYHDMGLVGMALGSLYVDAEAVLLTPEAFVKRPVEWLRAITRYRGTISFAPDFAYDLAVRRVKDADLAGLDLTSWRVAGCGAEPIQASTLAAFADKFRASGFRATSVLPSYGLAEHVLAATLSPVGREMRVERLIAADVAVRQLATLANGSCAETVSVVACGPSLPDHEVQIVGDAGGSLPERHIGEIVLTGPSVSPGYYNDSESTARTIRDGRLFTGDLGYLSNGELFVCGRAMDLIIVNGLKYHPQDLEWGIADLAGIRPGRVVAFGTKECGGRDRAVVVAERSGTVPADELTQAIRRRIVDVCGLLMDEVVLVPSGTLALTTSGKVRRAATKTLYERGDLAAGTSGVNGDR